MTTGHPTQEEMEETEDLVVRVQQGDTEAYADIVRQFQQPIFRYCCRLLGNRQDAEDAVQDIMVKAFQSIRRYKPDVGFQAWLYRIAGNHCLNLLSKRKLHSRVMRLLRPGEGTSSPEQQLDERLYSYPLAAALRELSPDERNLLTLRIFEQMSYVEIGHILQCSPNSLHKRMERVKVNVRKIMNAKEEHSCNHTNTAMTSKI